MVCSSHTILLSFQKHNTCQEYRPGSFVSSPCSLPPCHPERSEGSSSQDEEILSAAKDDRQYLQMSIAVLLLRRWQSKYGMMYSGYMRGSTYLLGLR
jgi:hypothetical protein